MTDNQQSAGLQTTFEIRNRARNHRSFLAMILSNGLAVCLSFTLLAGYLRNKLATDSTINSLALFGIFAGWFYFASAVIAPVTIGWGRLVSACSRSPLSNAMQRLRRSLASSVFARETTLIFALVMFLALLLAGEGRGRGVVASVLMLAASCLLYLALRIGLTSGYAHQIDPDHILAQFALLRFPALFLFKLSRPRACWCCSSF